MWIIDDIENKNVFSKTPDLKGKQSDYILYQTGTRRPIAIIEAKKGGVD